LKINSDIDIYKTDKVLYPAFTEDISLIKKYLDSKIYKKNNRTNKQKLPGTIWAITSFFNPAKYKNKYENYKIFRKNSRRQGLKLLTIELSFERNNSYEIKDDDADKVIKVLGYEDNILWQKEALLNIALKELPDDCDKIIWIDCDIVFHNDNWLTETANKLEEYVVVQPFSTIVRLPKNYLSSIEMINVTLGNQDEQYLHSLARGIENFGKDILNINNYEYLTSGHVGMVWAIRRSAIENAGGFFESFITGTNDTIMSYAFFDYNIFDKAEFVDSPLVASINKWKDKIYSEVLDSVTYIEGIIDHLWHGSIEDRDFGTRDSVLFENKFDPSVDISKSNNGLLKWNTKKPELRKAIEEYFGNRREEG
jgi:hypothetical protein